MGLNSALGATPKHTSINYIFCLWGWRDALQCDSRSTSEVDIWLNEIASHLATTAFTVTPRTLRLVARHATIGCQIHTDVVHKLPNEEHLQIAHARPEAALWSTIAPLRTMTRQNQAER